MDKLNVSHVQSGSDAEALDQLLWDILWKPLGFPRTIRDSFKVDGEAIELIAKAGERCVGGLVAIRTADREVELRHVAVLTDSQRHGIGRKLVAALIKTISSKGYSRINTIARNTSVDFFKKLGFRIARGNPPEHPDFKRHGIVFSLMEKTTEMKDTEDIIIRNFKKHDLIPVQELIYKTIDACYTNIYPSLAVKFFKDFHSKEKINERNENGQTVVVEQRGKILATGSIVAGEIYAVFVDPDFQRRGYGKSLMLELENRAKTMLLKDIELSVSLPSRIFYEKLDYRLTDECSIAVGGGQQLKFWKATKQLIR